MRIFAALAIGGSAFVAGYPPGLLAFADSTPAVLATPASPLPVESWHEFVVPDSGFAVALPAAPRPRARATDEAAPDIERFISSFRLLSQDH